MVIMYSCPLIFFFFFCLTGLTKPEAARVVGGVCSYSVNLVPSSVSGWVFSDNWKSENEWLHKGMQDVCLPLCQMCGLGYESNLPDLSYYAGRFIKAGFLALGPCLICRWNLQWFNSMQAADKFTGTNKEAESPHPFPMNDSKFPDLASTNKDFNLFFLNHSFSC